MDNLFMGFIGYDVLSIIIILGAMILFAMEKIPIALTALIASLAMGVTGVMPLEKVYAGFSSTLFVMLFGMLIIGDCLFETGLVKLIGQRLSRSKLINNELLLLVVLMCVTGVASAFLSNTAVMATMIPLVGAVAVSSNGRVRSRNLLMGLGIATSIGGAATLVGSTAQLMTQSILRSTEGAQEMGFFDLSYVVIPLFIITVLYYVIFGYRFQKRVFTFEDVEPAESVSLDDKIKVTPQMLVAGGVMLFCIVGFVTEIWNIGIVALLGATICLVAGCKPFKNAVADLDWNTLILMAAAQGFAAGLDISGGGKLLAEWALMVGGGETASPMLLLIIGVVVAVFLTNLMSNTAVAAMLIPIYINIAFQLGYDPMIFALAITIGASASVATPIGGTAMSMTLVAGYRFNDYVKVGLPLTIILTIATILLSPLMYGGFKALGS
ncbi:SLC13 family permease [Ignatzschineria rhizosphaerae]|uniref:SLC13 family permease n=1 Tax=Ignatzschineria rhizosphaerae TaxID=2923279 RepID=A0ABY3X6M0_9GAMM|nr:SLC13 family permease [Ignatzschineria rhizosphaerae]UNM96391.1 SLC13 family permease [Ignatzschineria rhizosphaerae]